MAWQDDEYISKPMGSYTTDFRTIPPCDYMNPFDPSSHNNHVPALCLPPKGNSNRKKEQVREEVWENLN